MASLRGRKLAESPAGRHALVKALGTVEELLGELLKDDLLGEKYRATPKRILRKQHINSLLWSVCGLAK